MTTTPKPAPRPGPIHGPGPAPELDLSGRLEAAAALPLAERAAELAAINEALASQLHQTEN
ncbi:MAG: hypothetical protein I3J03_05375 [Actinomyces succiniciruminis]|uniref:Uncharacterized protein n=1 Tax=Actinomyces succiniciruminis TaxID=1522002 RepID=A0A1L7RDZ5_9ACTO|nr:hypothetical protein [Actinomyces succiniciruminis]MBE6475510.1 hypothetical protein [Actinomyces succiniciruminis]MBM6979128.1 hypothetical protein [Actinomyces succiniciruminis]CED92257.1 Hypothetical protein AAM4_2425 [Actinomyces succiniciruminis]